VRDHSGELRSRDFRELLTIDELKEAESRFSAISGSSLQLADAEHNGLRRLSKSLGFRFLFLFSSSPL
jgi:hypothetical protein